jgi:molybdate transport system substrate-binding protein
MRLFSHSRLFAVLVLATVLLAVRTEAAVRLRVFAGAASKPPAEEIALAYQKATGVEVELIFGGSGQVLAQLELTRAGDIYFPGSSDFMAKALDKGLVRPETVRDVVYLVPAITVPKGNPKAIRGLRDLARPGLRVAIADPEAVCVGLYAVEILELALTPAERAAVRRNLATYTDSCERTATAVSLRSVDAVLGWSVFDHWDAARLETVRLPAAQVPRVGTIPIAVAVCSGQQAEARRFVDYVAGPEGRRVFARHGYFTTPEEAFRWLGATRPVGGEYQLPRAWIPE